MCGIVALMNAVQAAGLSESILYSISSSSPDLKKIYDARFSDVVLEKRPPLKGRANPLDAKRVASFQAPQVPQSVEPAPSGLRVSLGQATPANIHDQVRRSLVQEVDEASSSSPPSTRSSSPVLPHGQPLGSPHEFSDPSQIPIPEGLRQLLGVRRRDEALMVSSVTKFINMRTWIVEEEAKLPARIGVWQWLVASLQTASQATGPYSHLLTSVDLYDICTVFTRVKKLLNDPNVITVAHEIEKFFTLSPTDNNLAAFFTTLSEKADYINEIASSLDARHSYLSNGFRITKFLLSSKVINVASRDVRYSRMMEKIAEDPDRYAVALDPDDLVSSLIRYEQSCTDLGLSQPSVDTKHAAGVRQTPSSEGKQPGKCFDFAKGKCGRENCRFSHGAPTKPPAGSASPSTTSPKTPASTPPAATCFRCGKSKKVCNDPKTCPALSKTCRYCSIKGHMESCCRKKAAGLPMKVSFAEATDEFESLEGIPTTKVCMVRLSSLSTLIEPHDSQEVQPAFAFPSNSGPPHFVNHSTHLVKRSNLLTKIFFPTKTVWTPDTGSDCHMTFMNLPSSFLYRSPVKVEMASKDSTMLLSEKARLSYQVSDTSILLEDTIVTDKVVENLMSVAKIASECSLSFIFDGTQMRVFKTQGLVVKGSLVSQEYRSPVTGRYQWTLGSQLTSTVESLVRVCLVAGHLNNEVGPHAALLFYQEKFISIAPHLLNATVHIRSALARSYNTCLLDQSVILHERLAHFGGSIVKKVFPTASVERVIGCISCAHGKFHRHPTPVIVDPDVQKFDLLPGELLESDFMGPYSRSAGGAVFGQIFIDAGGPKASRFVGFLQRKVSGIIMIFFLLCVLNLVPDLGAQSGSSEQIMILCL